MLSDILNYISTHLPRAFKPASAAFPHPFVDPGAIYHGNLWDWDSYWTVRALTAYSKTPQAASDAGFRNRLIEHAKGGVLNFLHFQLPDGYIPMMVGGDAGDGLNTYLLRKRREGAVLNMHKPFLCQQSALISDFCGSYEWLRAYIPQFEKYFECYDEYYLNKKCGLYVWADDVMIGFDNDPATFGRPRFSTANVYLNAFMVCELNAMSKILDAFGIENGYTKKAAALSQAIQTECWDPRDQFFYSQDVQIETRAYDWFHKGLGAFWNTLPIKIRTWTGFIPLYAQIATEKQAHAIVKNHITDSQTFASNHGIRSLSRDEKMYDLSATNNPSNWLGPIWLVVNYVVFRGLLNYGYTSEALNIYNQSLSLLYSDLQTSGDLHEYYNPETGAPIMCPGFLNWNMLVVNMSQEIPSTIC
jgi:putative isomerase